MLPYFTSLKIKEIYDLAENLNQNKIVNRKITDVAISKVPYIAYPELSTNDSLILHELAEYCLEIAKNENKSNEVSLTYDLDSKLLLKDGFDNIIKQAGICFGNSFQTDLYSDTQTMSILWNSNNTTVINIHNHPSCGPFSIEDIDFFLAHSTVKLMIVVGNNGELYYMNKDSLKYNRELAFNIFKNSLQEVHSISDESYIWKVSDLRKASEIFFKKAISCGINYEHALGNNVILKKEKERMNEYDR